MKTGVADTKLALVSSVPGTQVQIQAGTGALASTDLKKSLPSLGVTIGKFLGFQNGRHLVNFPANPRASGLVAQTCVSLTPANIGRQVILAFDDNDQERPVILGLLVEPEAECSDASPINVQIDGERLVLSANREIVMRCGEASITLTRAGKVLIRGAYVLSRSSGANRIKGAAVEIN